LHGDPDDVQALSALFGVRYKPMGVSDIAHSNMLTILDQQGVIRYQMKGLGENLNTIAGEINTLADKVP
jgi:protein SCO1/2